MRVLFVDDQVAVLEHAHVGELVDEVRVGIEPAADTVEDLTAQQDAAGLAQQVRPRPDQRPDRLGTTDQALQRAEAAVRAFRPMVQVYTEHRRPTGITLHGLCGGTGRVTRWLDATITQASDEEQDAQVRAFAAAYTRCFGPRDPFLGRVQGFLLFLQLGQRPYLFTPDGQRLGLIDVPPLGASHVLVGSRRLPPGVFWFDVRE